MTKVHRIPKYWWLKPAFALLVILLLLLFASVAHAQGLVEYALILVLVAVVVIVILRLLGPELGDAFRCAATALDPASAVDEAACPISEDAAQVQPSTPVVVQDIFRQERSTPVSFTTSHFGAGTGQDNFAGLTQPVTHVTWWGVYGNPLYAVEVDKEVLIRGGFCWRGDRFDIVFYEDDDGKPGAQISSSEVVPERIAEFDLNYVESSFDVLYRFSAELPVPVNLAEGWIEIRGAGLDECLFGWVLGQGDSKSYYDPVGEDPTVFKRDFAFTLQNAQPAEATSDVRSPAAGDRVTSGVLGAVGPTRDAISDIAQAAWLERIISGNTYLSSADRATVVGAAGSGGFLDNESILRDPAFVSSMTTAIANRYGVSAAIAEWSANALLDYLVYGISIDHLFWLDLFEGAEFEPVFDAIDAENTLNSDAALVLGGLADPDGDGTSNAAEWEKVRATGLFQAELVNLFISRAEQVDTLFENGFEPSSLFPDLAVSNPTVSAFALAASEAFDITARAINTGGLTALPSIMQFYQTATRTVTPNDVEVGSQPLPGLDTGGSSLQTVTANAPSEPGSYWYGACADAVPGETEFGNQCSPAVEIQVIAPDLTVSGAGVDKSELKPQEGFTISATATNLSAVKSDPGFTQYYLSTDAEITTDDTLLGNSAIPVLAADASAPQSAPVTAPAISGDYWVGACAVPLPFESDTDNQCSDGVPIDVIGPDLTVGNPGVSEAYLEPLEKFTIHVTTSNLSSVDAPSSTTRFYRSLNEDITTDDTLLGTKSLPALAGGGNTPQSLDVSAPSISGTFYVGACVETVPNELITDNQCSDGRFIVVEAPDLIVINPRVSTIAPIAGTPLTIYATVKNDGAATSEATTLHFFSSADEIISFADFVLPGSATPVGSLAPGAESAEIGFLYLPPGAGTYYVGACVEVVTNERIGTNQCSLAASFVVIEL